MSSKEAPQFGDITAKILDAFRELDPSEQFTRQELAETLDVNRDTLYNVFHFHAPQFVKVGRRGQATLFSVIEDAHLPSATGNETNLRPDHGGVKNGRSGAKWGKPKPLTDFKLG